VLNGRDGLSRSQGSTRLIRLENPPRSERPRPTCSLSSGTWRYRTSALGWEELTNGDLLAAAESDGFELFITADKNIRYQQNLTERTITLIVLSTNDWPTVRGQLDLVADAVNALRQGSYTEVALTPRPLVRRLYNPPSSIPSFLSHDSNAVE
jgi:hypothetical protein